MVKKMKFFIYDFLVEIVYLPTVRQMKFVFGQFFLTLVYNQVNTFS